MRIPRSCGRRGPQTPPATDQLVLAKAESSDQFAPIEASFEPSAALTPPLELLNLLLPVPVPRGPRLNAQTVGQSAPRFLPRASDSAADSLVRVTRTSRGGSLVEL